MPNRILMAWFRPPCYGAVSGIRSRLQAWLTNIMPNFDKKKVAEWIRTNALPPFGAGVCATHVRKALEAGGLNTTGHPASAKDWGPTLPRNGFVALISGNAMPQLGDVVVMQSTSASKDGHIAYYDGENWISDFIQQELWPGPSFRSEKPSYKIYRPPS